MSEMASKEKAGAGTQAYLDIAEVREGTVVLKDASMRAVVVVSSTNFSLKSGEEQNALINSYQSFLNSLEFPIQIVMQSRKLDVHGYLDKLRAIMQQQTNELLRLQTQEYIEYVGKLIEFASIMNKTFYVVVPYSTQATKQGFFNKLGSILNPASTVSLKKQEFEAHREELYKRVNQVVGLLSSMGLRALVLDTEELIELMYNSYNFDSASPIHIKSVAELEVAGNQDESP
ncbi:MAG: hypothetical protein HY336_01420 [Candidatus Doudnabacteria bacterium]|nr:hypothetical protein [Candidatus Doudnabacteria bacterium]